MSSHTAFMRCSGLADAHSSMSSPGSLPRMARTVTTRLATESDTKERIARHATAGSECSRCCCHDPSAARPCQLLGSGPR